MNDHGTFFRRPAWKDGLAWWVGFVTFGTIGKLVQLTQAAGIANAVGVDDSYIMGGVIGSLLGWALFAGIPLWVRAKNLRQKRESLPTS